MKNISDIKVFTIEPLEETIKSKNFCIQLTFTIVFKVNEKFYKLIVIHKDNPKTGIEKYNIQFDELTKEIYDNTSITMTESYYFERKISVNNKLMILNGLQTFDKIQMINDIDIEDYFCELIEYATENNISIGHEKKFILDNEENANIGGINIIMNVSLKSIEFDNLLEILTDVNKIKSCKCLYKFSMNDYHDEEREYIFEIDNSYIYVVYCDDNCTCAGHHVRYYFTEYATLEEFVELESDSDKSLHDIYVEKYAQKILLKNYYYLLDMKFPRY